MEACIANAFAVAGLIIGRLVNTVKHVNRGVALSPVMLGLVMPITSEASQEWVDGFLFVGNQLALDFLNTRPVVADEPTELLPTAEALVRWLVASGVLRSQKSKVLARQWKNSRRAALFLEELIAFRERLRDAVLRLEAGTSVGEGFLAELNVLLEQHPTIVALRHRDEKLEREAVFEPEEPEEVWAPIAMAVAELFSDAPLMRVRQCESCIVHFLDTSKKGSRRWCSMNICGNKVKVAAYQRRRRATTKR